MSRAALYRAAGAYAKETFHELGLRLLQAAVLAGLRQSDGYLYAPDVRHLPDDSDCLYTALRTLLREASWMDRELRPWAEDRSELALPQIAWSDLGSWAEPLPLARLAASLLPDLPRARLTLMSNWIRHGEPQAARAELRAAERLAGPGSCARRGVLAGLAALAEIDGDCEAVLRFSREALADYPEDRGVRRNALGYALSAGTPAQILETLQELRERAHLDGEDAQWRRFVRRPGTYYQLRCAADPEIAALVEIELPSSEPARAFLQPVAC